MSEFFYRCQEIRTDKDLVDFIEAFNRKRSTKEKIFNPNERIHSIVNLSTHHHEQFIVVIEYTA